MAYNIFSRYIWLIDLLQSNDEMTFKKVSEAWEDEKGLNPKGEGLPLRTFHNHIKAIKEIFDIRIYYKDGFWQIDPMSWMEMNIQDKAFLSKLSLNNAILEYDPLKDRIIYEENAEPDNDFLRRITRAMNKSERVIITYKKFGKDAREIHFAPYCLKMFNHRWYLLGQEKGQKGLKVLAMDERMQDVKPMDDRNREIFHLPKDFNGKTYFDATVGVIVNPGDVQCIRVKAYRVQADYWRSAPVHHSQKEIERADGYSIFELYLNPKSIELEQLLFSKIDQIEVLEPESLRKKMISNIQKMQKRYCTGD